MPRPRHPRRRCAAILPLALLASSAAAVETQIQSFRNAQHFAAGEMDHTSISPTGHLGLSPSYRRMADSDDPVAWITVLSGDTVLVGTGHDGKVLRVARGAKPSVVLDTGELEVSALAVGRDGAIYAGTSPTGKVYRVERDGTSKVFFDPDERYIWALLPAPDAGLYVATGDKGAVYKVGADGMAKAVLSADETHILSLALAPDGGLFAGSGGNGYIYKIAPSGAVSVLLDTGGSEVRALVFDGAANLFAISTGRPPAGSEAGPALPDGPGPIPPISIDLEEGATEAAPPGPRPTPTPPPQPVPFPPGAALPIPNSPQAGGSFGSKARQSFLYRLRPDGLPEEIWRSSSETVHSLALLGTRVVLGTGDEGHVYAVDPERGHVSLLIDLPAAQVTSLTPAPGGLVVATANPATIWSLDEERAEGGIYTSPVIDAGHFATWGKVAVHGTGVARIATRSGNTLKPGPHWSAWQDAAGAVNSPRARYLQYLLRLTGKTSAAPAEVRQVDVSYLPYNLTPRVKSIAVLDPNIEIVSTATPSPSGSSPRVRGRPNQASEPRPAPREQESRGMRAVRWEADDPNGDTLIFSAFYQGEGEEEWKLIAGDLEETFVSFDSSALPDGPYRIKVSASDSPTNIDDRALEVELESEPFVVDNTPPRVELAAPRRSRDQVQIRVELSDRQSPIHWAEYAIDAGPWRPLLPEDEVFDENEEVIQLSLGDLEEGEHTVVVRAQDAARNSGSGKAVVKPRP